jgi:hypothetical protein
MRRHNHLLRVQYTHRMRGKKVLHGGKQQVYALALGDIKHG